jgi:hypothetical protein
MKKIILNYLSESYILNFSQITSSAIIALYVPLYIGLESYGLFAAIIAIPSIMQSLFESFCVGALISYKRADILIQPIKMYVLPTLVCIAIYFILKLELIVALIASIMIIFLFIKSMLTALVITHGSLPNILLKSEFLVLVSYVLLIVVNLLFKLNGVIVPMIMIALSCFVSSAYLYAFVRAKNIQLAREMNYTKAPKIPKKLLIRFGSGRIYEESVLTLGPLVLIAMISSLAAGQFRVYISVLKLLYKCFPIRHDILYRDVTQGGMNFKTIALPCIIIFNASIVAMVLAFVFTSGIDETVVPLMIGGAGGIVALLAIFPLASFLNSRIVYLFFTLILFVYLTTSFGYKYFYLSLILANLIILIYALNIIRGFMIKS